jgi:hypothetical protein
MKNMRNYRRILSTILVGCISFVIYVTPVIAATTSILDWHLVDSGKHLDWSGSTAYQDQFDSSVKVWNNYKSGVIRKDSLATINDVTISDYYEKSSTAGVTSHSGTIKFNTYKMEDYSTTKRKNVCIHELGHALGLEHNQQGDVMYAYVSTVTSLSANDKASYDKSYSRY